MQQAVLLLVVFAVFVLFCLVFAAIGWLACRHANNRAAERQEAKVMAVMDRIGASTRLLLDFIFKVEDKVDRDRYMHRMENKTDEHIVTCENNENQRHGYLLTRLNEVIFAIRKIAHEIHDANEEPPKTPPPPCSPNGPDKPKDEV